MWFAEKLGPPPKNSPQARADGPAKSAAPTKGGKAAPPPQRTAAPLQASRPAPAPEEPKKKKGWF
jgi:hypothetical protein